jgi:hypothetical protein
MRWGRSGRRATEEARHALRRRIHLVEVARARARSPAAYFATVNALINPLALLHVIHVEHDLTYRVGQSVSGAVPSRDSRGQRDLT